MRWYLDDDGGGPVAHSGTLSRGSVHSACSRQFRPQATLPGPPAGERICPVCAEREGQQPPGWQLRSTADRDTHYGMVLANGVVAACCGVSFRPCSPLHPTDPERAWCPDCRTAARQ